MLRDFFECAPCADPEAPGRFERLLIWRADSGRWRVHQGRYPVVALSLKGAALDTWEGTRAAIADQVAREYARHRYLLASSVPDDGERARFERVASGRCSEADLVSSLGFLTSLLGRFHGEGCVVIIDEYDAPMAYAHAHGFYDKAVVFMRSWLTDALKTNRYLLRGVLTGVQRVSKESIFSGLNNIEVSTPLNQVSDERFGFTRDEVRALAHYAGHAGKTDELRAWYDGYRFGSADIYNPWSVLSYLSHGCVAQPYWTNTSGNTLLTDAFSVQDSDTVCDLVDLLNPGASVEQWVDPNISYGDIGTRAGALWSVLYMSGYLTTDDTAFPEDRMRPRALRVPNAEVRSVFGREVAERARAAAGSPRRLGTLHAALVAGDAEGFQRELASVLSNSASDYDLATEAACHMLLLGLLFGVPGYGDPVSNREAGYGRFDIQLAPLTGAGEPLVTIEVKHVPTRAQEEDVAETLAQSAREALAQIGERAYDGLACTGRVRWGVSFSGKRAAAVAEVLPGC